MDQAYVTELTALLREGPVGDRLTPRAVFARRERPHPGTQLSVFGNATDGDGP